MKLIPAAIILLLGSLGILSAQEEMGDGSIDGSSDGHRWECHLVMTMDPLMKYLKVFHWDYYWDYH